MRRWVPALVAVVVAVAVALGTGYDNQRIRRHESGTVIPGRVGDPVHVGDRTFTVTRWETAEQFPAADPANEPLTAVPGAVLVLVVLRTDHGAHDPTTSYCSVELREIRDGTRHRRWRLTDPFVYRIDAPESGSCTGANADERVTEVSYGYQVPADAVPNLVVRVGQEDTGWAEIGP